MQVNGNLQHSPHWLQLPVRVFSTGNREVRVRVSFGSIFSSQTPHGGRFRSGRWMEVRMSLHIRETTCDGARGYAPVMPLVGRRAESIKAPVLGHYTQNFRAVKRRRTAAEDFSSRCMVTGRRQTGISPWLNGLD